MASTGSVSGKINMGNADKNYTGVLVALTSLFSMWVFIICINEIMNPVQKIIFELNRVESMLVLFAFFSANVIGFLFYFKVSSENGQNVKNWKELLFDI